VISASPIAATAVATGAANFEWAGLVPVRDLHYVPFYSNVASVVTQAETLVLSVPPVNTIVRVEARTSDAVKVFSRR
jgi:hypothetical protein